MVWIKQKKGKLKAQTGEISQYFKRYYQKHRKSILRKNSKWNKEHKERYNQYHREYYHAHKKGGEKNE